MAKTYGEDLRARVRRWTAAPYLPLGRLLMSFSPAHPVAMRDRAGRDSDGPRTIRDKYLLRAPGGLENATPHIPC